MTNTTVTNGQAFGTSTNIGDSKFPTKTTKQTATTSFIISAQVTNGAAVDPGAQVRVWFASTPFTYASAAAGMAALRQTAQFIDLRLANIASGVAEKISQLTTVNGDDIYTWADVPKLPSGIAASLSIKLYELP